MLLHALLTTLNREIAFDTDPTHAATTAAEAFSLRRGVCQDLTHIFVAAARSLDIPARYVGDISTVPTASSRRRPATRGRRPMSRTWAGLASIPPTAFASPPPMCGSRSVWTISAPLRYAAHVLGAAAKRSRWLCVSTRRGSRRRLAGDALPKGPSGRYKPAACPLEKSRSP